MTDWSDKEMEIYYLYFDNSDDINNKKINFAFEQAEKELRATIEDSDSIEDKAHKLLGLSFTSLTIWVGFLYFIISRTAFETFGFFAFLLLLTFLAAILFLVHKLLKVIRLDGYYYPGNEPEKLLEEVLENLSEYQLKVLAVMSYNTQIAMNTETNGKKTQFLQSAHNIISFIKIFLPILLILTVIESGIITEMYNRLMNSLS